MASLLNSVPSGVDLNLSGLDLNNHNSLVGTIIKVNAAFASAIAIVIAIRLYVRWKIVCRIGSDDSTQLF